jgi:hypothetical protein
VNNIQGFTGCEGLVFEIIGLVSEDGTSITQLPDTVEVRFEDKAGTFGMYFKYQQNI